MISVLVIRLSLYLMYFVRGDLIFFLQPRAPTDLGDAAGGAEGRAAQAQHPREAERSPGPQARPDASRARLSGYESFLPLLQTYNRVFVQRHRRQRATDSAVTGTHAGQLVPFDSLPYKDGLRSYFAKTMTIAHDLDFHAVARAKAQKTPRVMVEDRSGPHRRARRGEQSLDQRGLPRRVADPAQQADLRDRRARRSQADGDGAQAAASPGRRGFAPPSGASWSTRSPIRCRC